MTPIQLIYVLVVVCVEKERGRECTHVSMNGDNGTMCGTNLNLHHVEIKEVLVVSHRDQTLWPHTTHCSPQATI